MNLEAEILGEYSKRQVLCIGDWIGKDKARFTRLMELFLHGEYRSTQRAAAIVSYCHEKHPELVAPWIPAMVKRMQEPGVHIAVKRNVIRLLQFSEIPRSVLGTIIGLCFDELSSPKSPIAVRVFSMTVLANISKNKPDIVRELRAVIDQSLPTSGPAFRARSRMVLRQIAQYGRNAHEAGRKERP